MSTPAITRLVTTVAEVTSTQEREVCKDIHCDFEATCELGPDKFPRCSCKFDCASISPENMRTVCGSDHRTYPSLCAMKMEACQRQQELRLRPIDLCEGSTVDLIKPFAFAKHPCFIFSEVFNLLPIIIKQSFFIHI